MQEGRHMDLDQARARIDELFGRDGIEPQLQPSEYLELLAPIAALPDDELRHVPTQVRKFFYFGSRTFDRWSPPTPVVIEPELQQHYHAFINAFRRCELSHPNLSIFALHELQTELFDRWGIRSQALPSAVEAAAVEDVRRRARQVPVPPIAQLQHEMSETLRRVEALCDALEEGTVRSDLSVVLPHAVVRAPFNGSGRWRGLDFSYAFTPDAARADGMSAIGNALVAPVGLTRAESGTCRAEVTIHGLVDYNAWSQHLSGDAGDGPGRFSSGQPWCQTLLYFLLVDLIAYLQDGGSPHVDKLWVLTPRDISQLSIRITAGDASLIGIPSLSLGGWQVTMGPLEARTVDITDLAPSSYWISCRRHAQGYLTLGATRESLLWLNMAVESLIDERILSLTEALPKLRDEVTSSRLLFAEAETSLAEQFPEMAERVVWPDRVQAPSRFAQIKALCQSVPLPIKVREATSKYSSISKNRNDVIHGRDTGTVSAQAIAEGLEALQWLADNLRLPDHASSAGQ